MAATLNWELGDHLGYFRKDDDLNDKGNTGKYSRWDVLSYLLLRANSRLRCWPDQETIADDLAISKKEVNAVIQWLASRKALHVVPFDKRVGAEKKLHNRRNVYQLTGIIQFTEMAPIRYLYLRPGEVKELIEELSEMGAPDIPGLLAGFLAEEDSPENDAVHSSAAPLSHSSAAPVHSSAAPLSHSSAAPRLHYREHETSKDVSSSSSTSSKELARGDVNIVVEKQEDDDADADPKIAEIFTLYEQNMPGTLTALVADTIKDAIGEFGVDWVRDAIREGVLHNARNWPYIDKILRTWRLEGRDTRLKRAAFPSPRSAPPPPQQWFDADGKADPDGIYTAQGTIGRAPKDYQGQFKLGAASSG